MKKQLLLILGIATIFQAALLSQPTISFVDSTALLPTATFHSGNAIGVCDMNNDGKDDIVRDSANKKLYIEYQQAPNAHFTQANFPGYFGQPWGLCIGDYDNNGFNDVFEGSSTNAYLFTANATGTAYTDDTMTTHYGGGNVFVQGCNFADIDNDGKLDIFICHDSGMPKIYQGNGTAGGWTFNQGMIPLATVPSSDNSGNYASIWTDVNGDGLIDMMITHCRQGITNSSDARRIDQIFINNGNGTYTQDVTNWTGLRDGEQGWSTAWGDINNDGVMDAFVLNQTVNAKMQINNGSGVFTDIMSSTGIANPTSWFGENATFEDFDNDGYNDLLLSGDEDMLYHNNHDSTFTLVSPNPFPYASNSIRGHAVGDLNGDGFLDVYATYCNLYNSPSNKSDKLWMNNGPAQGNTNNWIKFYLEGVQSNRNGIGAIVKIYGSWGVQVREVRSGEAYGIQNSFTVHFGLGQATQVDSVIVHWPSGTADQINFISANQTVTVVEGSSPLAVNSHFDNSPIQLNVYPNPVTDQAAIRIDHFSNYGLINLNVNIYDVNGKLIYNENNLQNSIILLDRGLFASGLYFVQVTTDKNKILATEKMMVE